MCVGSYMSKSIKETATGFYIFSHIMQLLLPVSAHLINRWLFLVLSGEMSWRAQERARTMAMLRGSFVNEFSSLLPFSCLPAGWDPGLDGAPRSLLAAAYVCVYFISCTQPWSASQRALLPRIIHYISTNLGLCI